MMISTTQLKRILIALNILSALFSFYTALNKSFNDGFKYLSMSKGFNEGRFSSWYFLNDYYPETLRTPGYPLFIYLVKSIYDSNLFLQIVQLFLYFTSLYLVYEILKKITNNNSKVLLIFLFLTAINIQIPFYAGYISAEMLTIFCTALYMYLLLYRENSFKTAILLGIVAGINYLARPAFILFPFITAVYLIMSNRKLFKFNLTHLASFIICVLPFTIWNYQNHGVFKPTPLEGGAGLAHMSYWSFKLPFGYKETFQWDNKIMPDATSPFDDDFRNKENIVKYEKEWGIVNKETTPLLSDKDKNNLKLMKEKQLPLFITYNSKYTIHKEHVFWDLVIKNVKENPLYYLKTRVYTFIRLYFTGFNFEKLNSSSTIFQKFNSVYPFFVTFVCICLGLFISLAYFASKNFLKNKYLMLISILCVYQGLVHVFFTIASRYTVSVHFFILIIFSVFLYQVYFNKLNNEN